ncbi:MAG TPA: hypothetical protein VGF47_05855, partial [Solirubrobacteraceae bacterium]
MTAGYDAPRPEPEEIQGWLRKRLLHEVDFCVVCLTGPSTGCGWILTLAEEFGIPVVVFAPRSAYVGPLVCGARLIRYETEQELGEKFGLWLAENDSAIAKADARRCGPLPDREPERLRECEVWRAM